MIDKIWYILIFIMILYATEYSRILKYKNYKIANKINYKSLLFSLGTKLGVGSIIGTVICIIVGGYGSIFWLWFFTFLISSLVYFEAYLGAKYKFMNYSGPYCYISKYSNNNVLPIITSIVLVITYSYLFMIIQVNTIKATLDFNFAYLTVIIFGILLYLIFYAKNKILNILNNLVIIMCMLIIICALKIVVDNYLFINTFFKLIVTSAFSKKGITAGLLIAVKRCVFLNEILIGTTSIASGIEEGEIDSICYTQVLGCYFISFIISSLVAFIVILYLNSTQSINMGYIDILKNAFTFFLGPSGLFIFKIIILLLSITTIISGVYIGSSTIGFIFNNKLLILFFKIFMLLFCLCGMFIKESIIWKLIDAFTLILVIINLISFNKLKGVYNDWK